MSSKQPRIFLDIDQTLLSAEPSEDYDYKENKTKSEKFTYHNMEDYYIVFERPGLQEFLEFLFKTYTVSVWTAASKDYALFVIDKIILKNKPERKLDYIFFSYHCDLSSLKKTGTKDLSTLWDIFKLPGYGGGNTVILDDYDEVHRTQPGNCIIALPFEFTADNSEKDEFLRKLQPHLGELAKSIQEGQPLQDTTKQINQKMKE